ncbi:hypothetical protein PTTG_29131 [Puccinia triticina 1-1 BBBD Race 1]|uniref:Uncharacterized protein n=1 Tax=Puccinia triticina (isolate 1-1 / race 1 (BBBD)) TaxID=630390 RepID=A0A180G646_PUCT1|nr:hypothetical protein PTTG_29131 [Puccinia triticina 1-1 BBBD Race 1]
MEEEVAFTLEQIKSQAPLLSKSEFKESNEIMKKMEANRRPKEAPVRSQAPATVDDLSRMLQSFEQRLKKELAVSSPAAAAPSGSRGPLVCYYGLASPSGHIPKFGQKKAKCAWPTLKPAWPIVKPAWHTPNLGLAHCKVGRVRDKAQLGRDQARVPRHPKTNAPLEAWDVSHSD